MKFMIIATALAMNPPVQADDAHYDAQLTACELVIALDNAAEEADELVDSALRRRKAADAKVLADLADASERLADKVDRLILAPLERGATFAYARAQLRRLADDFDDLEALAGAVRKRTRYLDAELELVATFRQDLNEVLAHPDRGRSAREEVVSR